MAADWVDVRYEGGLTRIALVKGYGLTVTGSQGMWSWFVDLDGRNVADGIERYLTVAMTAAENEAHRLAGDLGDV